VPDTALIRLNVKSEDEVLGSPQSLDWDKELCESCRKASANMEKGRVQYRSYSAICEGEESKSRCLGCAILFEVGKTCLPELAYLGGSDLVLQFWGNEVKRQYLTIDTHNFFKRGAGIRVLLSGKPGWCLHGHLLHCLILFRPAQSVKSGNLL
jgi:hypothetical protein